MNAARWPSAGKNVIPPCRTESYEEQVEAREMARKIRRGSRIRTKTRFCYNCNAYHLVLADGQLEEKDREIIKLIAMGFRIREIAKDTGLTVWQVKHRIWNLQHHFDALSSPHLIAIAIWLSVIDVSPFVPKEMQNA